MSAATYLNAAQRAERSSRAQWYAFGLTRAAAAPLALSTLVASLGRGESSGVVLVGIILAAAGAASMLTRTWRESLTPGSLPLMRGVFALAMVGAAARVSLGAQGFGPEGPYWATLVGLGLGVWAVVAAMVCAVADFDAPAPASPAVIAVCALILITSTSPAMAGLLALAIAPVTLGVPLARRAAVTRGV